MRQALCQNPAMQITEGSLAIYATSKYTIQSWG